MVTFSIIIVVSFSVIIYRYEHLDEILVYDYDGRLQQKLKTNAIIVNLAVTSDGTLMILAYDKKMEELSIYRSKINI